MNLGVVEVHTHRGCHCWKSNLAAGSLCACPLCMILLWSEDCETEGVCCESV